MYVIPAGFFKDALNPSDEELLRRAYIEGAHYPPEMSQDWDLMIADPPRADLLLRLASDDQCPNRDFFLSCLYLIIGNAIRSKGATWPLAEVSDWLAGHTSAPHPDVATFIVRSQDLLERPDTFDYNLWCRGGHAYGIDDAALLGPPTLPRRWWEFGKIESSQR